MTVASGGLEGLEQLWGRRSPRRQGTFVATAVAVCLHIGIAAALVRVDTSGLLRRDAPVEMDIQEPTPPPPEVKPETPPPPPPPEAAKPRLVVHHVAAPTPPSEAPPPPSSEPPKAVADTPPVFGVSLDSTVGEGPGMAVPVGNTLMTKPHKAAPAPTSAPAGTGDPDGLPAPVPEVFIAQPPRVVREVSAPYPPDLQRMGIEGHVTLKLYIDENGDVRRVTVVEKAGHGFDELAREALRKFKFSPAHTSDGKAVPTNIVYKYKFELPQ